MPSSQISPPTSSTSLARELPPELWLRILSFLPPGSVHKMMGVDRKLFYLVLSEKYSEIQFGGDGKKTSRTFRQLNCPNIAALVKTLHLNPTFLPGPFMEDDGVPLPTRFSWLRQLFGRFLSRNRTKQRTFKAAFSILLKCSNLRGISITVSDTCPLTSAFVTLLRSLPQKTANGIEKIAVCTTPAKIPEIFESISKSPCQLSSLKSLDITIEKSRASLDSDCANLAIDAIVKTIHDVSATLTYLKISSPATEDDGIDLVPLFQRLGPLPNLRAFDVILGTQTLASDGGEGLTAFLKVNGSHLKRLLLKPCPQPGETVPTPDDPKLREWLTDKFTGLSFPELHTLEIDLSQEVRDPMKTLRYFPQLEPILPSLTSLTLSHAALSLTDLGFALSMATGTQLASLRCTVKLFSPQMLDVLATKAPHLTSLDLTYEEKAVREPSLPQALGTRGLSGMSQVGGKMGDSLYGIVAKRKYPKWGLSRLRIAHKAECGGTHPHKELARSVTNTVSRKVVLDLTYHGCCCGESEGSHTGSSAAR